jgi:hypothetical protein
MNKYLKKQKNILVDTLYNFLKQFQLNNKEYQSTKRGSKPLIINKSQIM